MGSRWIYIFGSIATCATRLAAQWRKRSTNERIRSVICWYGRIILRAWRPTNKPISLPFNDRISINVKSFAGWTIRNDFYGNWNIVKPFVTAIGMTKKHTLTRRQLRTRISQLFCEPFRVAIFKIGKLDLHTSLSFAKLAKYKSIRFACVVCAQKRQATTNSYSTYRYVTRKRVWTDGRTDGRGGGVWTRKPRRRMEKERCARAMYAQSPCIQNTIRRCIHLY